MKKALLFFLLPIMIRFLDFVKSAYNFIRVKKCSVSKLSSVSKTDAECGFCFGFVFVFPPLFLEVFFFFFDSLCEIFLLCTNLYDMCKSDLTSMYMFVLQSAVRVQDILISHI